MLCSGLPSYPPLHRSFGVFLGNIGLMLKCAWSLLGKIGLMRGSRGSLLGSSYRSMLGDSRLFLAL